MEWCKTSRSGEWQERILLGQSKSAYSDAALPVCIQDIGFCFRSSRVASMDRPEARSAVAASTFLMLRARDLLWMLQHWQRKLFTYHNPRSCIGRSIRSPACIDGTRPLGTAVLCWPSISFSLQFCCVQMLSARGPCLKRLQSSWRFTLSLRRQIHGLGLWLCICGQGECSRRRRR